MVLGINIPIALTANQAFSFATLLYVLFMVVSMLVFMMLHDVFDWDLELDLGLFELNEGAVISIVYALFTLVVHLVLVNIWPGLAAAVR